MTRRLRCADCGTAFELATGEERFFAARGFEEPPRRCPSCRKARKAARRVRHGPASDEAADEAVTAPVDVSLPPATRAPGYDVVFDAICACCGAAARVRFRPASGRPVYCDECYTARQGHGSGLGGP